MTLRDVRWALARPHGQRGALFEVGARHALLSAVAGAQMPTADMRRARDNLVNGRCLQDRIATRRMRPHAPLEALSREWGGGEAAPFEGRSAVARRSAGPLGFEPDPASLAPVLFVVPERLIPPVERPLPAAPGDEPEPASFGPVLFAVPERLEPPAPLSAAKAVLPRARMAATTSSDAFI